VLAIKSVDYSDNKMRVRHYMADFPFDYFLIVRDVRELGDILASTLLQFIQEK
jgi:midasin (ATPase involved in ribosome maturation)